MRISAFALAIGGFYATNANKTLTPVWFGVFRGSTGVNSAWLTNMDPSHFTTINNGHKVCLATSSFKTIIATLVTNTGTRHTIYFH